MGIFKVLNGQDEHEVKVVTLVPPLHPDVRVVLFFRSRKIVCWVPVVDHRPWHIYIR